MYHLLDCRSPTPCSSAQNQNWGPEQLLTSWPLSFPQGQLQPQELIQLLGVPATDITGALVFHLCSGFGAAWPGGLLMGEGFWPLPQLNAPAPPLPAPSAHLWGPGPELSHCGTAENRTLRQLCSETCQPLFFDGFRDDGSGTSVWQAAAVFMPLPLPGFNLIARFLEKAAA